MIRKTFLLLLLSVPLAAAVATATPRPVLLVMAGFIVLVLSIAGRAGQQE